MTTLYLIDVDQVSMVAGGVTALTDLAETYLNTLLDVASLDAFPVAVALHCIRDHVGKINELLNAGIAPSTNRRTTMRKSKTLPPIMRQMPADWQAGFDAAWRGELQLIPDGMNPLSFCSGFIEGLAEFQRQHAGLKK